MRKRRSRRAIFVALAFAVVGMLASMLPARALDCSTELEPACRLVLGTYCQVTHRNPCFP